MQLCIIHNNNNNYALVKVIRNILTDIPLFDMIADGPSKFEGEFTSNCKAFVRSLNSIYYIISKYHINMVYAEASYLD